MTHIPQLVSSEYKEAQSIFYNDLLFGCSHLFPIQSWQLKDNLDLADFGESWLTYPENQALLQDSDAALLRHMQSDSKLRALFLTTDLNGDMSFNSKAIDIYEAQVQDFLKRMMILIHITAGQPIREPEILSIT